jgi:dimethylargininase
LTREVSPSIGACELTHIKRQPIDFERARAQHAEYEMALYRLGCEVRRLPAEPSLPDSVFIEDTAVILDEVAILSRPGSLSRRPETATISRMLAPVRQIINIRHPGTLEGGDVLRVGKALYIGLSKRTNAEGIEQVKASLAPFGYTVQAVPFQGCLHLKAAVSLVADGVLLLNPKWVDKQHFAGFEFIEVDESEPLGANALRTGGGVIYPTSYPETRKRLNERGIYVEAVDLSELIKAEGAVTCCSLLYEG